MPVRRITWGPFRARGINLAMGLLFTLLFPLVMWLVLIRHSITCDRGPRGPTCAWRTEDPLGRVRVRAFPGRFPREVRTREIRGQGVRWHVVLVDDSGRELTLSAANAAAAAAEVRRLREFVAGSGPDSVTVVEPRSAWFILIFTAMWSVGVGLAVNALRRLGPVRLVVDTGARRLEVVRTCLWVPYARARVSLDGVSEVRVETGSVHDWTYTRGARPDEGGRLVLVRGGEVVPLSPRFQRGGPVHERAAAALRAALGLAPAPHPEPAPPARAAEARARAAGWRNLTLVLGLFAAALVVATLVQSFVMRRADETRGWLNVRCLQRCRFGGVECLPGGSWRDALAPGTYTIELWNPEGPSRWEPRTIVITRGQTVDFVCRRP